MKKPWAGRFTEGTAASVERYTGSVSFDWRLWRYDIQGSIAHARMLGRQGIIAQADADTIIAGLGEIAKEIQEGRFAFREDLEDIHMNIEAALIGKTGEAGARLHTARSRNDQVALDMRLYLRDAVDEARRLLKDLCGALLASAETHLGVVMPGYTHLQRAQPVLLSHHLMAYAQMFARDRERFGEIRRRINVLPLGSCALAGTTLPIDRRYVAELLGFEGVSENSIDAVSDRDFAVEFLAGAALCMMHASRMAEELVLWSTEEFSFIVLPDAYTTGSSIMPQKKNPDVAELMRGKTGRVYGSLVAVLTMMKGLPLSYNRDMQEDKEPVFDSADTLTTTLAMLNEIVPRIAYRTGVMEGVAGAAFSTATDIAEYLVRKGVPFRNAHEITGAIVRRCIETGRTLANLTVDDYRAFSPVIQDDIFGCLTPRASVESRNSYGGPSPDAVRGQIDRFRKLLDAS